MGDDQLMAQESGGSASLELIIGLEMLIQNGSPCEQRKQQPKGAYSRAGREERVRMKRTGGTEH